MLRSRDAEALGQSPRGVRWYPWDDGRELLSGLGVPANLLQNNSDLARFGVLEAQTHSICKESF